MLWNQPPAIDVRLQWHVLPCLAVQQQLEGCTQGEEEEEESFFVFFFPLSRFQAGDVALGKKKGVDL